jgi:hypothetical protein
MSYRTNTSGKNVAKNVANNVANNAPAAAAVKKQFCKICFDAGKKESEYTTHFVKDQGGKVICPYLLYEVVCGFCKKKEGHTTKNCPRLPTTTVASHTVAAHTVAAPMVAAPMVAAPTVVAAKKKSSSNAFNALANLIEKEEQEIRVKDLKDAQHMQDFPTIITKPITKPTKNNILTGWSLIAQKKTVPDVAVPTVAVPTVAVPTVAVPTVAVPTVAVVAVPTVAVPTVAVPTVDVPTVTAVTSVTSVDIAKPPTFTYTGGNWSDFD